VSEAKSASSGGVKQTPLLVAMMPLLILFVCAVVLYGLSADGATGALGYWEIFVWVVAAASIIYGWAQAYAAGTSRVISLILQVLVWGALFVLLDLLEKHGLVTGLDEAKQGIMLIYLLGFTTLIVSLLMNRTLFFFAIFVVFCGYLLAVPTNNPTLIAVGDYLGIADAASKPFMMSVGMAVVACIASLFVLLNLRGAILARRAAQARG
jgi:hypothetical protein